MLFRSYKDWQTVLKSIQLPPSIKFLTVSKNEIIEGESVTFAWSSENAVSVEIDNVSGVYGAIDKKIIKPKTTTSYKIIFKGYYGEVVENREIKVTPAPKVIALKADTTKIKRGNSTTIYWEFENITKISLHGIETNPVSISQKGTQTIKPEQTTTYKFEVFALDGKTQKEEFLTIEVFEEGKISFFKADRHFIFPTIPVTLSWEVQNAVKVEIEGIGEFQLFDKTIVQPTIDTIYKLKVTDNFGLITENIQVKMLPLPVIEKLIISTPIVKSNSVISIKTPVFASNCQTLPKTVQFNDTNYNFNVDSTLLDKEVNIREIDFAIIKIPFLKRVTKIISLMINEFKNEKNRRYVAKK